MIDHPLEDSININIEVCYLFQEKPILLQKSISMGTSIEKVLVELGFEIPILIGRIGVFGQRKPLDTVLKAGDRIEIYEPLLMDPKEARRLRALKTSKKL